MRRGVKAGRDDSPQIEQGTIYKPWCRSRLIAISWVRGELAQTMLIGVPREVKTQEYRVGLVPGNVRELVHHGHKVVVEAGAGAEIGFDDAAYEAAGADILRGAAEVFGAAELIVKVKEPQPQEVALLREGQVLFTYLHLAADKT